MGSKNTLTIFNSQEMQKKFQVSGFKLQAENYTTEFLRVNVELHRDFPKVFLCVNLCSLWLK